MNNLKKTNKNSHTDVEKKKRSSLHSGIIFNRSFDKN